MKQHPLVHIHIKSRLSLKRLVNQMFYFSVMLENAFIYFMIRVCSSVSQKNIRWIIQKSISCWRSIFRVSREEDLIWGEADGSRQPLTRGFRPSFSSVFLFRGPSMVAPPTASHPH